MAPRDAEMLEAVRQLSSRVDDMVSDRSKARWELLKIMLVPGIGLFITLTGFYFTSRAESRERDAAEAKFTREIGEIKSTLAQIATMDRQRLQQELDKTAHELERLKKP